MSTPEMKVARGANLGHLEAEQNGQPDFANDRHDRKAFASMQARAALAGFQLHELADGDVLMSRWGLSRALPDLYAVGRFLDMVTGVRR